MLRFWHHRLGLLLALTVALGALASALPDNPYQRWQLLNGTIHANARWIFERIHYDATPIDVVFVGPSRLTKGVNAALIGAELAKRNLPANVVNFGMPETGRNLNAAIVDELLKAKRPRLIVIGVIEKPSRYGHSAYKYVAPASDIVNPSYFANLNYFSDLIYLPYRQLKLFTARILPGLVGLDREYNSIAYRGHVLDTTGDVILPDGTIRNGTSPGSAEELARGAQKLKRLETPPLLPHTLREIEFGDERHFIRHIAEAARARGVKIAFLSLPYYTGPATLQEAPYYAQFGPIWAANDLAVRADLFADYGHLTTAGSTVLSKALVDPVAHALEAH